MSSRACRGSRHATLHPERSEGSRPGKCHPELAGDLATQRFILSEVKYLGRVNVIPRLRGISAQPRHPERSEGSRPGSCHPKLAGDLATQRFILSEVKDLGRVNVILSEARDLGRVNVILSLRRISAG